MRSLLGLCALYCAATAFLSAGELEDILENHYKVRGGAEALDAIKTIKYEGKIKFNAGGQDIEMPMTMEMKDRKKIRMHMQFQGMDVYQVHDGERGWMLNPLMGATEPQDMKEDEAKQLMEQADFLGDLFGWKDKGYTLELQGEEEVEGSPAYKIKVTTPDGDERFHFLDKDYYVLVKTVAKINQGGTEVEGHLFFSDYKEIGDVVLSHAMEMKSPEGQKIAEIRFDTIELNPEISDDIFVKPEPAKAEPADSQ